KKQLEVKDPEGDWGCAWEAEKLLKDSGGDENDWSADDQAAEVQEYVKRLRKAFHHKCHTRLPAIVQALAEITSGAAIVEALNEAGVMDTEIRWSDESESY